MKLSVAIIVYSPLNSDSLVKGKHKFFRAQEESFRWSLRCRHRLLGRCWRWYLRRYRRRRSLLQLSWWYRIGERCCIHLLRQSQRSPGLATATGHQGTGWGTWPRHLSALGRSCGGAVGQQRWRRAAGHGGPRVQLRGVRQQAARRQTCNR